LKAYWFACTSNYKKHELATINLAIKGRLKETA